MKLFSFNVISYSNSKINFKDCNYAQKRIIYHSSFSKSGLYSTSCLINDDWYYIEDNTVNEERKFFIIGKPIIIILFYEKK